MKNSAARITPRPRTLVLDLYLICDIMPGVMESSSTLPGVLIDLLKEDDYSVSLTPVVHNGQKKALVTATKDGHEWRVIADDEYLSLCELLRRLGSQIISTDYFGGFSFFQTVTHF